MRLAVINQACYHCPLGAFVQQKLPGQGPIFLTDVVCSGHEQKLVDCSHKKFNDTGNPCGHNEELSISCVMEAEAGNDNLINQSIATLKTTYNFRMQSY